jgi:hypothetical protein
MCASKLDSQFAGQAGRVALAASPINIKNRPLYDPFTGGLLPHQHQR